MGLIEFMVNLGDCGAWKPEASALLGALHPRLPLRRGAPDKFILLSSASAPTVSLCIERISQEQA